jgi:hypothetical protein
VIERGLKAACLPVLYKSLLGELANRINISKIGSMSNSSRILLELNGGLYLEISPVLKRSVVELQRIERTFVRELQSSCLYFLSAD